MQENEKVKRGLYSEKIKVGRRTYFFDVKENNEGDRYLVITESKAMPDNTFRRDRIMIFEEYIEDFEKTFKNIKELLPAGKIK